jgi:glycosyltransferase involved in cell wall biosynthesis
MSKPAAGKSVILLATAAGPRNRGIGQYERYVLPPLLYRLLERGATPTVILSADGDFACGDGRVRILRLPARRDKTLARLAVEQVWVPWAARGADLFVSLESVYPFPPVPARRRMVVVHDIHVLRFRRDPERFPEDYSRPYALWAPAATRRALRASHKIIAVSEFTRREILDVLKVDAGRVVVVPNGLDHSKFHPPSGAGETERVRAKYNLPPSFYLFVGPCSRKKNLRLILDAYRASGATDAVKAPVAVAGDTRRNSLYGELLDGIRTAGLGDRFLLLGSVPDSDLPGLYAAARAFLYPSLYEGFGLPMLEAMACGVPVVAADGSSLPEVAGGAALLIDPRDPRSLLAALERVGRESERAGLVGRGLARAREFSWERTAECLAAELCA